jgi:cytochrome c biogenesis protein ResB
VKQASSTDYKKTANNGNGLPGRLSSLKLAITLLFFITALCLVGTVFPQRDGYVSYGHGLVSWISSLLSPYGIFHSIWFMGAGLLLCINLILCMWKRAHLKRRSLLMLLLHGSILLVIAGYGLGFMSLDGFMEIPEGSTVSRVMLKNGSSQDLGFSVRCDRFAADYYPNGMPKEYISDLSFIRDGQVASRAQVKVNHPASFSGINFYQESFNQSPASAIITVSDGQKKMVLKASEGDILPLPSGDTRVRVVKIWSNLMHAGPAVKLLIEGPSGGRYLWVFRDIDAIKSRVPDLFERMPQFDPSGFRPYTFSCEQTGTSYTTGIGVKHDPGTPLVGAGGLLFLISLLLVFLLPRTSPGVQSSSSGGNPSPALVERSASDTVHKKAQATGCDS